MSKNKPSVVNNRIFFAFALCVGTFFSTLSSALPIGMQLTDTQKMNEQLSVISQKVLNINDNYEDLTQALHASKILEQQLQQCMETGESKLEKINHLLNKPEISNTLQHDTSSYTYLSNEKNKTLSQVEKCHFLKYRLDEITDIATDKINKVAKVKLFIKSPETASFSSISLSNIRLNTQAIYMRSGIEQLDTTHVLGLVAALIFGWLIALALRKKNSQFEGMSSDINRDYLLFMLPLSLVCIYANYLFFHIAPSPILLSAINGISLYAISLVVISFYISIGMRAENYPKALPVFLFAIVILGLFYLYFIQIAFFKNNTIPLSYLNYTKVTCIIVILRVLLSCCTGFPKWCTKRLITSIHHRILFLATVILLSYLLYAILATQPFTAGFLVLLKTIEITILPLVFLWLTYPILNHGVPIHYRKKATLLCFLICLSNIFLAWHGYLYLGSVLIPNLIITAVVIWTMKDIYQYLRKAYVLITGSDHCWSKKIHKILGLADNENPFELFLLLFLAILPAFVIAILSLMEIWGTTRYQVYLFFSHLHEGVAIVGGDIRPAMVIRGVTFFSLIVLSGRIIASYLVRTRLANEVEHTKVIVISLTQYLSYAIGILVALYIMGFNFRSLVVVAGAFSVGLGFGLQNVAKDFICGLIIIMTKPIKIGDHIEVGDRNKNEGFIRRIGMLSTQLHTLSYSDVIIPNSEIITKIFTNFTFKSNALSRIKLKISLDKDSNFNAAKQLLLEVAMKHPNVVQATPYQPVVLFELYDLTLWFVINDVNKKADIISDLNLAIAHGLKGI